MYNPAENTDFWPGQPPLAPPMLVRRYWTMVRWNCDTKGSSFFAILKGAGTITKNNYVLRANRQYSTLPNTIPQLITVCLKKIVPLSKNQVLFSIFVLLLVFFVCDLRGRNFHLAYLVKSSWPPFITNDSRGPFVVWVVILVLFLFSRDGIVSITRLHHVAGRLAPLTGHFVFR